MLTVTDVSTTCAVALKLTWVAGGIVIWREESFNRGTVKLCGAWGGDFSRAFRAGFLRQKSREWRLCRQNSHMHKIIQPATEASRKHMDDVNFCSCVQTWT